MELVSSSQDILYVALAVSALWFTAFLCWALYQAARVLKNANDIIETITDKLELINEAVQYMRSKVDTVSKSMNGVSGMMTGLVEKLVIGKLTSKFEEKIASRSNKKTVKKKTAKKSTRKKSTTK